MNQIIHHVVVTDFPPPPLLLNDLHRNRHVLRQNYPPQASGYGGVQRSRVIPSSRLAKDIRNVLATRRSHGHCTLKGTENTYACVQHWTTVTEDSVRDVSASLYKAADVRHSTCVFFARATL